MNNVHTLERQRTVGELTADDLGREIIIDGFSWVPMRITHVIDEVEGTAWTIIDVELMGIDSERVPSDTVFTRMTS